MYWNCSDYWGVGPAAHSCVGNVRQFWPDDVQGFIAGTVAEQREGDCTSEDYLLMQLRLVSGLNIPAYERRGETDPEQEPGSAYLADEVMFMLPAARAAEETQESIAADFSGWWKYGEAWEGQEKAPTVEERLAVMEDFMVAIMEG